MKRTLGVREKKNIFVEQNIPSNIHLLNFWIITSIPLLKIDIANKDTADGPRI